MTADEGYGQDPALRVWLEGRRMAHVLAVKCTEPLAFPGPDGRCGPAPSGWPRPCQPSSGCRRCAGQGAKGRRLYDWARIERAAPASAELARWLLVRRRRSTGELAFYACFGPVATTLLGLARVAGARWAIEEGFQQAKGEVGLDHYEVRKWPGWYRHTTLALLAHAYLVVTRTQASSGNPAKGDAAA